MLRVHLVRPRDHVKATDDQLAVPQNRLAGLIQPAVAAVPVRALRQDRDLPLRVDLADGVVREIRDEDIVPAVDANSVRRPHLGANHLGWEVRRGHRRGEIGLGENRVAGHAALGVERDLVQRAVPKVAHQQIASAVERQAVGAVLAVPVKRDKRDQQVRIVQRIRHGHLFVVQPKAIHAADQQPVVPADFGQQADRDVNVAAVDANAVGVTDAVGHDGGAHDPSVANPQPQQPALIQFAVRSVAGRPVLIVADIQIAVGSEGDAHRTRSTGLGQRRYVDPRGHAALAIHADQAARPPGVGKVGTGHHQVPFRVDRHAVGCGTRVRQRHQQLRAQATFLSRGPRDEESTEQRAPDQAAGQIRSWSNHRCVPWGCRSCWRPFQRNSTAAVRQAYRNPTSPHPPHLECARLVSLSVASKRRLSPDEVLTVTALQIHTAHPASTRLRVPTEHWNRG